MGYISVEYVVKRAQSELDESTTANYDKYEDFCIRGIRELNIFRLPHIEVVEGVISPALTFDLPSDYVSYKAIGVCIGGRIITFTNDENICLNRDVDECCEPLAVPETPLREEGLAYSYYFLSSWRNEKLVGELYGMHGRNELGYFKIDKNKNRIQFANTIPQTQIIVEYVSNGIKKGNTCVPEEILEVLISWIMWKRVENNPNFSRGDKADAKDAYLVQYNKITHFILSFTADEYTDDRTFDIVGSGLYR